MAGRRACADLWPRLVAHFDVIACALMPDHVHLFARAAPEGALRAFAQILGAFRARAIRDKAYRVGAFEWESLPAPGKVRRDPRHIGRAIRSVKRYRPLADPRRYFVVSPPDASLSMLADSVTRALRSPRSAPVTFDLAERRLYLLSAAKWTRYRATELARSIGSHPASVRRFLQGVHGAMQVENDAGAAAPSRFRMSGGEARAIALMITDERLRWNGLSSALR
ncbi:MAG: hypothetical protein H3C59_09140 [Burkholderiaceae bacterium]|nr:hypothetical protein [Burkholderiaceae bacterium]